MKHARRDRQPIDRRIVAGVRGEERLDFTTQRVVAAGRRGEKRRPLGGRPFYGGFE